MPERTALILGSGFTDLVAASDALAAQTDYGVPSSAVHRVSLSGQAVLALARHGDAHSLPPHRINYRANIAALRGAGATGIIALNTVGVIGRIRAPGQIAVPDQVLDYTWGREHTFFTGNGAGVEHLEFTEPFATAIRRRVLAAAAAAGVDCLDGGVYAATQGPRLETAAEVDRLERDGADYIGMTAMPEAALAAEAGIDYVCVALIVNRAAGRGDQPIHADLEASSATARGTAMRLLEQYYADNEQST